METKNKRMSLGKKELAPFGIDINDKGRVLRALVDQQKINDIEKKNRNNRFKNIIPYRPGLKNGSDTSS